jgi:RNA polymerase sigma-70 factor (ECF subfamily)
MDSDVDLLLLMARYAEGDSAAAAALVNRLSPNLHRFFMLHTLSRRHADDLLQDTWLRIHEVRHTYRQGSPVLPWLYAIARHVRVDHYRKALRAEGREQQLDERAPARETRWERDGGAADIDSLLAILPESQREVIVLLKIVGLSLEEVARATSSTVGSVKQKAHRAYDTLRKELSGGGPNAGKVVLDAG